MNEEGAPYRVAGKPIDLGPAPRAMSKDLLRVLRYGWVMAQVAWGIAAVGAVGLVVAVAAVDFDPPTYDTRVEGTAGDVRCRKSKRDVHCEADYAFIDRTGNARASMSSDVPRWVSHGDEVVVEYDSTDSRQSRIVGSGDAPIPWQAIFIPLGLHGLGLLLVMLARRGTNDDLHLLRFGLPTTGTLISRRDRRIVVQGHNLYALTFEYVVKGETYQVEIKPFFTKRLEDDAREAMVYDPSWPKNATTLDHLPGAPTVLADGTLGCEPGFVYHLFILPAVTWLAGAVSVVVFVVRILR